MSNTRAVEPGGLSPVTSPAGVGIIDARLRDLGGFVVRRTLPSTGRRMVGPFIFFDHFGPMDFPPGGGMTVRPHPHIGLATVTYLFEGEIIHRDSLGSHQAIRPGDINWMTAGRGIVHSERTHPDWVARGSRLHGLQLWVALPRGVEEAEPSFHHHPAGTLPGKTVQSVQLRVLAGTAFGISSPVACLSSLFYVDAMMPEGSELGLPSEHQERAVYVVEGAIQCGDDRAEVGRMLLLPSGADAVIRAEPSARIVLVGGAPLDGERHIDWNFVSSSQERLTQARQDWKEGRFPKVPGDEVEFIPLPE
ncbi:MAG TPA: pirin family protein [Polyangiaceae bacterium]|jgi:redox-sensitive bicupin YhaK (pirin superfamily)|nr:pirin family protein [Polyangiaceae bacterium]